MAMGSRLYSDHSHYTITTITEVEVGIIFVNVVPICMLK